MIKKLKNLKSTDKVVKIDHANPRPDLISEAALIIKNGGVISFPTRYLYGLGADAFNADAVDRIFKIKQRPYNKPLLVLVDKSKDLTRLVRNVPSVATHIMERFWPGEVTIVFEAKDSLPENLIAGTDRIGVRMPEHPVALALTNSVKGPITATSANITGQDGCSRVQDLDPLIADKLDLILDAGPLKGGIGSTVIDVTVDPPKILREGAVSSTVILAALDRP
ncbi:MAG: L-threonylcarbamoyladenylate synthase [Desulfobacterales bacterium]